MRPWPELLTKSRSLLPPTRRQLAEATALHPRLRHAHGAPRGTASANPRLVAHPDRTVSPSRRSLLIPLLNHSPPRPTRTGPASPDARELSIHSSSPPRRGRRAGSPPPTSPTSGDPLGVAVPHTSAPRPRHRTTPHIHLPKHRTVLAPADRLSPTVSAAGLVTSISLPELAFGSRYTRPHAEASPLRGSASAVAGNFRGAGRPKVAEGPY